MYWITTITLLFAINGSLQLSWQDWTKKDVCPKLLGLPVCYIVFVFFIVAGLWHAFPSDSSNNIYFALVAVPTFIALGGTIMELSKRKVCPRTSRDIPMCYISLAMCLTLLISKYFSLN